MATSHTPLRSDPTSSLAGYPSVDNLTTSEFKYIAPEKDPCCVTAKHEEQAVDCAVGCVSACCCTDLNDPNRTMTMGDIFCYPGCVAIASLFASLRCCPCDTAWRLSVCCQICCSTWGGACCSSPCSEEKGLIKARHVTKYICGAWKEETLTKYETLGYANFFRARVLSGQNDRQPPAKQAMDGSSVKSNR